MKGLRQDYEALENVCPKNYERLVVSNQTFNFYGMMKHCNRFGKMAEIINYDTAIEVNKTLAAKIRENMVCSIPGVYSGYTDIETEGEWVLHNTNKKMTNTTRK